MAEAFVALSILLLYGAIIALSIWRGQKKRAALEAGRQQHAQASGGVGQPNAATAAPGKSTRAAEYPEGVAQPTPSGSLAYDSLEGMDLDDHEHSLNLPYADEETAAVESSLHLTFARDQLLNAFVMQEILTRPEDRKQGI